MPSPFLGMDPYIELFEWEDFHTRSLTIACELLTKQLPKGYVARVERRSYLEMELDWDDDETERSPQRMLIPDLAVLQARPRTEQAQGSALMLEPLHQRFPELVEHH